MSTSHAGRSISVIFGVIVVFAVLIAVFVIGGQFFYVLRRVDAQEVGVQLNANGVKRIVGPGVYNDFGLYVSLVNISVQAIPFEVTDPEIITKDKQRLGITVSGNIFRPGIAEKDLLLEKWAMYRNTFTDDRVAIASVTRFAQQAMKVCVGDRTFEQSTIGTTRDDLRECIDSELDASASEIGLTVRDVMVPEILLSAEAQAGLDAIVQSRLLTEKAAQDKLKAEAEAAAEQARVEGEIRVEQAKLQETTRQQVTLAELERQRVEAQLAVIEAQRANSLAELETQRQEIEKGKANEILTAQRNLEIRKLEADALEEQARGETAREKALATLFTQYPEYQMIVVAQTNASALSQSDKIIFTPVGTTPTIVMPGPGITPTVDTTPVTPTPQ